MLNRPTLTDAALEADRQLRWDDLLSSANFIRAQATEDGWAAAVRACADAKCCAVSPSAVILHRMGPRTWGGIGLATAFALALGLIPTFGAQTRADDRKAISGNRLIELSGEAPVQTVGNGSSPRRSSGQQEPEDGNGSRMGRGTGLSSPRVDGPKSAAGPSHELKSAADPAGRGVGAAQSESTTPPPPLSNATGTPASTNSAAGHATSGAGQTSSRLPGTGAASGDFAGQSQWLPNAVPPWQSSNWTADSEHARSAVESGRIPDSYRDVIQGYFDRP
jgi:hypothetical protein